jgi:hypothetical protein
MRAVVLLVCLALSACSAAPTPDAEPRGEVAAHERLWREAGLEDYRFAFRQECFCVREQVQPVTIEVRNGRIARVVANESGQDLSRETNLRWRTIPELFALIAEAQANGVDPLMVQYDPRLGYPTRIEIGSLAADAGVIYSAADLEPVE